MICFKHVLGGGGGRETRGTTNTTLHMKERCPGGGKGWGFEPSGIGVRLFDAGIMDGSS